VRTIIIGGTGMLGTAIAARRVAEGHALVTWLAAGHGTVRHPRNWHCNAS
jgi:predicted dinucleotide-binding enzyme